MFCLFADLVQIGHFASLEKLKFKGACGEAFKDVLKCAERTTPKEENPITDPKEAAAENLRIQKVYEKQREWEQMVSDGKEPDGPFPTTGKKYGEPTACRIEHRELIECLHWNPDWPEQS